MRLRTNITPKTLAEIGFIQSSECFTAKINCGEKFAIALIKNRYSFLNKFIKTPVHNWKLTITGIDADSDCLSYSVSSIEEIQDKMVGFIPQGKKINRMIAKLFAIILLVLFLCFLLS